MPNIIMRPATAGAKAAQAKNLPLQPQPSAQIVCAALMGKGVERLEEAIRLEVPFVLEAPKKGRSADLMPQRHQLNEMLMAEMAEKILSRAYERAGVAIPDEITLQFQALRVVEYLKQQILEHGLHVYSQKLLFDARLPLAKRLGLFEAMVVEKFPPRRASVAIASGRMPHLPAYTVAELVRALDNTWLPVSFALHQGIKAWIGSTNPWLVEFPLPNLAAGDVARTDHFDSSDYSDYANLGLGFFLLSFDEKLNRFHVVTPTLVARRLNADAEAPVRWVNHYHYEDRGSVTAGYRQLADLVGSPARTKLARLEVCAKCGAIFSKDRADLAHAGC